VIARVLSACLWDNTWNPLVLIPQN